ncbi:alpha/beta hydrolase [Hoyosella rhizosphaerae]|uniref:Lipase n=1 Tax=Hoyosella rhizosphaerae TaxID=1755582 RepID=A0A916U285_9ACTN|nr:lipase family protein [Hoyosella rhizosphaerae]MBN4926752.1 alpha/beta hydrolase [Hoyosella rhizosphaerae]GGC56755.1 lipase [Hoyosella rhizosphaerae]
MIETQLRQRAHRYPLRVYMRATVATLVATTVGLTVGASGAAANPLLHQTGPYWSELDVRDYSNAVPAPGTLVDSSQLDPAVKIADSGYGYRIAYSTTDHRGEAALSTASVHVPPGTPPPGGWPVIAWGHGTTGIGDTCAPSTQPANATRSVTANYPGYWLRQGFAVVATDYVGLSTPGIHPYLHAEAAANSVIDSVRSAHGLNLRLSRSWVAIGHSQGGAAALSAAHHEPRVAGSDQRSDFRGAVALAPATHVEDFLDLAAPLPQAIAGNDTGYLMYILAGMRDTYPDLDIDGYLTARGRSLLNSSLDLCSSELAAEASGLRLDTLFSQPMRDMPGFVDAAFDYMALPEQGYNTPLLIAQGLDDSLPPNRPIALADRIAVSGSFIALRTYDGVDHNGVLEASLSDVQRFVEALFTSAPERTLRASGFGG